MQPLSLVPPAGLLLAALPLIRPQEYRFFDAIPKDLEESAMVDGSSRLYALCRVILPLTIPGMVASALKG